MNIDRGFFDWLATTNELDQKTSGIVSHDSGLLWHRICEHAEDSIRVKGTIVHHFMIIEVNHVAPMQPEVADMLRQYFENRCGRVSIVRSMQNRLVRMKFWGRHELRYIGLNPGESAAIDWDGKRLTLEKLIGVLRFDRDPNTLKILDKRINHIRNNQLKTDSLFEKPSHA